MADKPTPTITLAELYENQNQYIDALVIYKDLYKDDPTEKLQSKIDELKDKIFKENTLEYSKIIDKIFTEEEKRIFHILPHDQFKAYKESQADLKNEETYPEELIEVKKEEIAPIDIEEPEIEEEKTPDIEDPTELETEIDEKDTIELDNTLDNDDIHDELTENKEEELEIEDEEIGDINDISEPIENIDLEESIEIDDTLDIGNTIEPEEKATTEKVPEIEEKEEEIPEVEKIPEIDKEEIPDIDDTLEPEEKIDAEENINPEDTLEKEDTLEDDISLEINEDISDDLNEQDIQTEDGTSIKDLTEEEKQIEQNVVIDTGKTEQPEDNEDDLKPIDEPQSDNHILELLTNLSKLRPDIVERVLKENVGQDASLAEIKLTDLHFVVELLKASNNVEKE